MEKLLQFIFVLWLGYCLEEGYFRMTERRYCRKNKGICKNCNCWSCEKAHQDHLRSDDNVSS